MHIHKWSNWQDVDVVGEESKSSAIPGFVIFRQVIRQQRRCSVCNLVKTRAA